MDYLPWIDIETTGLDPVNDGILEIGLVITDLALNTIEQASFRLRPTDAQLDRMIPLVHDMHVVNGLLEQVVTNQDHSEAWSVESALRLMMEHFFGEERPPMCGSSVGFDREFLRYHLPGFYDKFSYRNIDVSTVKELAERYDQAVWARRPQTDDKAHRAIADAIASVDELRYYLETRFIGGFDPATGGK